MTLFPFNTLAASYIVGTTRRPMAFADVLSFRLNVMTLWPFKGPKRTFRLLIRPLPIRQRGMPLIKIMGLTRSRILGQRPRDFAPAVPDALIASLERKSNMENGVLSFEAEVPCADGRKREFLFAVNMLPSGNGQAAGRVGVMQDLTQKNRAARERARREKFQGVLETAGGVCHEMNQPLQVISGYTEIMMGELSSGHRMFRLARQISEQVDRLADITSKLQKITHYETMEYGEHDRIIDIHKSAQPDY